MYFRIDNTDARIVSRYASQCAIANYERIIEETSEQPDIHKIGQIIEESVIEAIDYHRRHCNDAFEHFNGKPLLLF